MNEFYIRNVIEAALLAAGKPLQLADIGQLFDESTRPKTEDLRAAIDTLAADYSNRGIEVKETAAGFRIQVRREFSAEISRLWPERPARYSRALLETLALIAYRQPITRAEIESVRGVAVNPNIVKTVIERNWVRVVGHRDVPGRPELLGTTREFLDYFGLRSLDELPPLAELKAMGDYNLQLELPNGVAADGEPKAEGAPEAGEGGAPAVALLASDAPREATDGGGADQLAGDADSNGALTDANGVADESVLAADSPENAFATTADGEAGAAAHVATADGDASAAAHTGVADADASAVARAATADADASDIAHTGAADADASGAAQLATVDADASAAAHVATADTDTGVAAHTNTADADTNVDSHAVTADPHGAGSAHTATADEGAHDASPDAHAAEHAHAATADANAVAVDDSNRHEASRHSASDSEAEAERTLSAGEVASHSTADSDDSDAANSATSNESADPLDDSADDDADEDELSADGHGSRELVAAPPDLDD